MLGKQATFDRIARHLLFQLEPSTDAEGALVLRGVRGLKSPVGLMLGPAYLLEHEYHLRPWELIDSEHVIMIEFLERTHDLYPPEYWIERLYQIAKIAKVRLRV